MSTRAAIAQWTNKPKKEWAGRYHHWDGYPTALGATLFHLVRDKTIGGLGATLQALMHDHPAGWSTINGANWRRRPGYEDHDKERCKKCGRRNWEHYAQHYTGPALGERLETILAALPPAKADRIRGKEEFVLWHSFEHDFERPKRPQCYCHGDRHEDPWDVTQSTAAGS